MFLRTEKNKDLGHKLRYANLESYYKQDCRKNQKTKYYQKDKPIFHLSDPEDNEKEEI